MQEDLGSERSGHSWYVQIGSADWKGHSFLSLQGQILMRKRRIFRKLEWLSQNRNLECCHPFTLQPWISQTWDSSKESCPPSILNFWASIAPYQVGLDLEKNCDNIVIVHLTLLELEGQLPNVSCKTVASMERPCKNGISVPYVSY